MIQTNELTNCYCEADLGTFKKLLDLGYSLRDGMTWDEKTQDRFLIKSDKTFSPIHEKNEYAHGNATLVFLVDDDFYANTMLKEKFSKHKPGQKYPSLMHRF